MLSRRLAIPLAFITVTAALAACTSSGKGSGTSSSPEPTALSSSAPGNRPDAWRQVLDEIGPNGEISKGTALRAFALAFGSLPGVSVPEGKVGFIPSGTGALRWLMSYWDEITDEQRAAAIRFVPELAGPVATPSTGSSFLRLGTAPAPRKPPLFYREMAKGHAAEISKLLPTKLTLGLELDAAEGAVQDVSAGAETFGVNAAGGLTGVPKKCAIRISRGGANQSPDVIESMIAHEVWHCFQLQILGMNFGNRAPWILEGEAEWVGDTIQPNGALKGAWSRYVRDPGQPLFARVYDAIGFYAHLDEAKLDTWSRLIPILTDGATNDAAFEASGANSDQFLDSWASGFFRQPTYGKAWEMTGPGLPSGGADVPLAMSVKNGYTAKFNAGVYANSIWKLSSAADVSEFKVSGHLRLVDPGDNQEYIIHGGSRFCTKSGGCECPPGTEFAGVPPNPLSTDSFFGVSSAADATTGTVSGRSLDEFCEPTEAATWHFDSPSSYSVGASHTVIDAYTCGALRGPWQATVHITHSPADSGDPPLDVVVRTSWTFNAEGRATPTIGPHQDTIYGTTHTITYFPLLELDEGAGTITIVSLEGIEDNSPRLNGDRFLGRIGEPVPFTAEKSPTC